MEKCQDAGKKIPDITGDVAVDNQEISDSSLDDVTGGVMRRIPKAAIASACNCIPGSTATSGTVSQIDI